MNQLGGNQWKGSVPFAAGKPVSGSAHLNASMHVESMTAAPHVVITGIATGSVKKATGYCCFLQSQTVHSPRRRHIRIHREEERSVIRIYMKQLCLEVLLSRSPAHTAEIRFEELVALNHDIKP